MLISFSEDGIGDIEGIPAERGKRTLPNKIFR